MCRVSVAMLPVLFFVSCVPDTVDQVQRQVEGYVPVYATATDVTQISIEPSRATEAAGKIYAIGNYIFQNELYKGIHIIDNSNRASPKKAAFLKLPFNTEMAVKGNYLYANNLNDLVVIDISNVSSPRLVKRVENVFPLVDQKHPPLSSFFECVDPSKGIVVNWEKKLITNPKCRR